MKVLRVNEEWIRFVNNAEISLQQIGRSLGHDIEIEQDLSPYFLQKLDLTTIGYEMNTHQVPNESQDVKSKFASCNIMEHLIIWYCLLQKTSIATLMHLTLDSTELFSHKWRKKYGAYRYFTIELVNFGPCHTSNPRGNFFYYISKLKPFLHVSQQFTGL